MPNMNDPKWDIVMPIELTAIQWAVVDAGLSLVLGQPGSGGPAAETARDVIRLIETCLHTEGLLTVAEIKEADLPAEKDFS